ncbi:MAG: helix-turn-helix domain-containing protein [Lachnospiraceae bacterium]
MQKLKADMNIGCNLRSIRNHHHYTQDQIVAKLGILDIQIIRSTYARYETGELNIPISVLVGLQKIYKCTYDDFFQGLNL